MASIHGDGDDQTLHGIDCLELKFDESFHRLTEPQNLYHPERGVSANTSCHFDGGGKRQVRATNRRWTLHKRFVKIFRWE